MKILSVLVSMISIQLSFILLICVITKYVEMVNVVQDAGTLIFSAIVFCAICDGWIGLTIDWISNILKFFSEEDDDDDLP